ncbi:9560_t:CDS:2, partial [Acaulospora colombiana]
KSLSWASGRIYDKIQKRLEDSRWSNLFLKIQNPDDPSGSRGILFESHVLHLIKVGGKTFESRRLKENKVRTSGVQRKDGEPLYGPKLNRSNVIASWDAIKAKESLC